MSNQDYYQKYIKYKQKYINLKSNDIILQGGGKKCTIEETDKVLFGDGGSSAIIVITKDKKVYKIYTKLWKSKHRMDLKLVKFKI